MVTLSKRIFTILTIGLLVTSVGFLGGFSALDESGSVGESVSGNESENGDDDTENVSEAELLAQIEDTQTYQFELNQSTETVEGNVTVSAVGEVDQPNERLYMSMSQEMDVGLGGEIEMEQYIIGDTQYLQMQGVWQQMEVPQDDIWEQDELSQQGDVIEAGELEVVGTETVNDVETTVVRVDGTDELLDELEGDVDEQLQQQQALQANVSIENVTYHFYVDEETHTLHRTETEMTIDQAGERMHTTTELTFFGHNEPVDIELPDAAEDADEIDEDPMTDSA